MGFFCWPGKGRNGWAWGVQVLSIGFFDRIVESLSCYFERQYCLHNIDSTTGIGALKSEFFVLNVVVVGDQVNIEILSIFSVRRIIDEGVIVQVFDSAISGFWASLWSSSVAEMMVLLPRFEIDSQRVPHLVRRY